jgi:YggT family protein
MGSVSLLLQLLIYVLIIAVFVRIAFSWIGPNPTNSVYRFAFQITEPVLRPIRNLLPPMAGLDFSPTILLVVLFMLLSLVSRS